MLDILKENTNLHGKKKNIIANYFLEHSSEIINMSIYEVAGEIGVSPASVTRFCSEVFGMSYMETKIAIAKQEKTDVERNHEIINWGSDIKTLPFNLMKELDGSFKHLCRLNKSNIFEKCINEIVNSEKVIIFGAGNSGIIAQDFFEKMVKIRKNAIYAQDNANQVASSLLANDKDVVLAISNSGLTREIITAAKCAKEKGAKIITITSNTLNPLRKLADYSILEPNIESNIRLGAIFSRYLGLFVVDILFIGTAQKLLKNPDEIINSYNELIDEIHK